MTSIALIGLGVVGIPMARNLLAEEIDQEAARRFTEFADSESAALDFSAIYQTMRESNG